MGKLRELATTTDIVKDILQTSPEARNSDDYLYFKVCDRISAAHTVLPFWKVILNRKKYGFPAFESVRRTRQKLQATYPELAGCDSVENQRLVNEAVFREYARKGAI